MNALKDRTSEFRSAVESARLRSASTNELKRPLLADGAAQTKGARSEFARMAAKIGKDIQGTTFKLEKLAQRESRGLARRPAEVLARKIEGRSAAASRLSMGDAGWS